MSQDYLGIVRIIVVDDASTDRTLDLVRSLGGVQIIENKQRLGRSGSRNRGLDEVKTELVAIQDADDISLPHRLAETVPLALNGSSVVGSQLIWKDKRRGIYAGPRWPETHVDADIALANFRTPIPHPSMLIPTDLLKGVGGYDQRFPVAEDLDLMLRLKEKYPDLKFATSRSQSVVYERPRFDSAPYSLRSSYWRSRVEEIHTGKQLMNGSWVFDAAERYVRQRLRYARGIISYPLGQRE